jgi:hypothetical protein
MQAVVEGRGNKAAEDNDECRCRRRITQVGVEGRGTKAAEGDNEG